MAIKEVSAWKTEDGNVFYSLDLALQHEARLEIMRWVNESGIGRGGHWTPEMIGSAIIDGARWLWPFLTKLAQKAEE